jgi:hypothetical protein
MHAKHSCGKVLTTCEVHASILRFHMPSSVVYRSLASHSSQENEL